MGVRSHYRRLLLLPYPMTRIVMMMILQSTLALPIRLIIVFTKIFHCLLHHHLSVVLVVGVRSILQQYGIVGEEVEVGVYDQGRLNPVSYCWLLL